MAEFRIETERLVLREWRVEDAASFYPMGQDEDVMAFLGPLMSQADAHQTVVGQILNQLLFGHCFWPVERRCDDALLGFCGLNRGPKDTPLEGKIEIGWRLARSAWGRGYAHEAALASLDWAWVNSVDDHIFAMTVAGNIRSWGLMERLGMTRRRDLDFDHPALANDDSLRPHIVYSIARPGRH